MLADPAEVDNGQYLASLQSSAGFLVGKLDWAAQTFFNISLIEQAVKPLAGDWTRLEFAARGYDTLGHGLEATAVNLENGAGQLCGVWRGEAATNAGKTLMDFADGHRKQSAGCKTLAEQLRHVCEVSKTAGQTLAAGLGVVGELLTQLIIENSVPVIGNAFSALDLPRKAIRFFGVVNKIMNAIQKVMKVIAMAMQIVGVLQKLMGYLTTMERSIAGGYMDDTARVQFGV